MNLLFQLEDNLTSPLLFDDVIITPSHDDFEGVYDKSLSLNWFMLALFVLGLCTCPGLLYVSWFERSGQAGPFRTILNQLVSFNMDQVRKQKLTF